MGPKGHGGSRGDLSSSASGRARRRRRNGTGSGSQGANRMGNGPTGRSVLGSGLQTSHSGIDRLKEGKEVEERRRRVKGKRQRKASEKHGMIARVVEEKERLGETH